VVGPVTCNLKATSPQWMMRQAMTFHCQLSPANPKSPRRKTRQTKSKIFVSRGKVALLFLSVEMKRRSVFIVIGENT